MPSTPNTSKSGPSGLSSRCFQLPGDSLREATPQSSHGRQGTVPMVHPRIAGISNVPHKLTMWGNSSLQSPSASRLSIQQHLANLAVMPRHVVPPAWAAHGLILRIKPLPAEADTATSLAVIRTVFMSLAAGNSEYWRQTLNGPALCICDADARVLCRISPEADGCIGMQATDASIVLRNIEPPTYNVPLVLPDQGAKPFSYAAVQAARPKLIDLMHTTPAGYHDIIASHASALDASMLRWLESNDRYLEEITPELWEHFGLSVP